MSVGTFKPNDPLYASQWHLSLIGRLGFSGSNFLGLERIWADYTGSGIAFGIWDDGTQNTHWDLNDNYDASKHLTINGTLNNGQPITVDDGHGSSAAGLIVAESNGQGGVGVSFNSKITGIRIFGGADDINESWDRYLQTLDSLGNFDVTNHSYGGFPSFYVDGDIAKFRHSVETGRSGLGTINVKSAGNDDVDGNGDSLDASRFTITVGALESTGQVTWYSTYGSHLLVSAPAGSVTTDLLGNYAGYNGLLNGDYTNQFGGTSAAGPITAGVIGLMLDANPDLGWRDVQNILAYSASGTGSLYSSNTNNENFSWKWNGANNWNGGGLHYSEDYGYGVVNAFTAVRFSEVWGVLYPTAATSSNEASITSGNLNINSAIADLSTLTYNFTINQDISLEHVSLNLNFTHSYIEDLRISLISPNGTEMSIYNGSTGSPNTANNGFDYTFGIDGFRGESSVGTWTIKISDVVSGDSGFLDSANFTAFGSTPSSNNVYTYTDEVFSVLSKSGQSGRLTLTDSNSGSDWINASAMWKDVTLNLNVGATSTMSSSNFLRIDDSTLIENAITGDGNDFLIGNNSDNILMGMRGNDTLIGADGTDYARFIGDYSDYLIESDDGITYVTNSTFGKDTLFNIERLVFDDTTIEITSSGSDYNFVWGTTNSERLTGTASKDMMISYAGNDKLYGGANNDFLDGGIGSDSLYGELGDDTFVIDNSRDRIFELSGQGNDTVQTTLTRYTLLANFENLIYTGSLSFTGTGNTLNNDIEGGSGNDQLRGGLGSDTLTGAGGADRFIFGSVQEAGLGVSKDIITDFNPGQDIIDLSLIDANSLLRRDQAFSSNIQNNFTGQAGQLIAQQDSENLIVLGDINGDSVADFAIQLNGISSINSGNFIL